jgi:putative NIF3 family GTP cyclohydrolase 1 type 2
MPITAQQVIDRVQHNLGITWMHGVDICEAGDHETPVTGIATSWTASLDVLHRAQTAGRNLIITRERPFWSHENKVMEHSGGSVGPLRGDLSKDPLFAAKSKFIEENRMVVWRFQENWDARPADGQMRGLAKALGWEGSYSPSQAGTPWARTNNAFKLQPVPLKAAVQQVKASLKCTSPRVIGDPELKISRAALMHGFFRVPDLAATLRDPAVDLILCGEPVEWEAAPYFMDVVACGRKIAMIILGNQVSEEPGSGEVAAWLKAFVSEVPVEHLPTGEPFRPVRQGA